MADQSRPPGGYAGTPGFSEREERARVAWGSYSDRPADEMTHDFRAGYHRGVIDEVRRPGQRAAIDIARNIINQIGDLWAERIPSEDWVKVRQSTNDELDAFAARLIETYQPEVDRVFLVTSGEYSGYSINSVWSTLEAAEKAAGTWAEIEEWLVGITEERTVAQWHAWINVITGEIKVADQAIATPSPGKTYVEQLGVRSGSVWSGHGFGPSPEHARKALADALAKAKAEHLEKQKEQTHD